MCIGKMDIKSVGTMDPADYNLYVFNIEIERILQQVEYQTVRVNLTKYLRENIVKMVGKRAQKLLDEREYLIKNI